MNTNRLFESLIAVCAVAAWSAGCSGTDRPDPEPGPAATGELQMAVAVPPDAAQDVQAVLFEITGPDGYTETQMVPLTQHPLPLISIPGSDPDPADYVGHRFADYFTVVNPGDYHVIVTPYDTNGNPSEFCARSEGDATVREGQTVELLLVSQCSSVGSGGLDTTVVFNTAPFIEQLLYQRGKYVCTEQAAHMIVTASDPDGDAITYAWSVEALPAGATPDDYCLASIGPQATFSAIVPGTYTLAVKVSDASSSTQLTFPVIVSICGDVPECPGTAALASLPGGPDATAGKCNCGGPLVRQWIPLDPEVLPGTPAVVTLDVSRSTASDSFFDVFVYGVWSEERVGPDGKSYQMISVPGLASHNIVGAPDLPAQYFQIALPGDNTGAWLSEVESTDIRLIEGVNCWPQGVSGSDCGRDSEEDQFSVDEELYATDALWPADDAASQCISETVLGTIPSARCATYPVRFNPVTSELVVSAHSRFHFAHPVPAPHTFERITRDRYRAAAVRFLNWPAVIEYFPWELVLYQGEYLIVTLTDYLDELLPFINLKKTQGFSVSVVSFADPAANTCASIQTVIDNWYTANPTWHDHYALLVGDVDAIPLCTSPTNVPTDDLYGSTNGADLAEEVYVGRLSVDEDADVSDQVTKIIAYENAPAGLGYGNVILAAHKEDAPAKYVAAHEAVRTASYTVTPNFITQYGHIAGVTNASVSALINGGVGLVAYRGHGGNTDWWEWNVPDQDYANADVIALTNAVTPPVWSFSCWNGNLNASDSISEVWMGTSDQRAVSHYGSTVPSSTSQNHELDFRMFEAVYDLGLTRQSHAIEYAEEQMAANVGSGNAWMYLLLGDPAMNIRRSNPDYGWEILIPDEFEICPVPPCEFPVSVIDEVSNPVPLVQVSLWKGTPEINLDEVLDNRYTNEQGEATIPISPTTAGTMYYSVQDEFGHTQMGSVEITTP